MSGNATPRTTGPSCPQAMPLHLCVCPWFLDFSLSQQAVFNSGRAGCCHKPYKDVSDQAELPTSCSASLFVFVFALLLSSKQGSIETHAQKTPCFLPAPGESLSGKGTHQL